MNKILYLELKKAECIQLKILLKDFVSLFKWTFSSVGKL